jgi:hypothetical protein
MMRVCRLDLLDIVMMMEVEVVEVVEVVINTALIIIITATMKDSDGKQGTLQVKMSHSIHHTSHIIPF